MTNEELLIKISADISELKDELQKGKKEVEKFGKEGKGSFDTFNEAMGKVGSGANKALGIATTAIAGATTALLALSASTAEYRTNQAKLTTAFETAGASAETAKETYNDLYRVLGDDGQATEAAAHLSQLTTSEQDLAEWTNICQGVYATFGDSLPIESLTEAANETAKTGAITGALADALNWAGISEEQFQEKLDACNSEAEREALIRESLNGIYSEASANYEKNAADVLAANEAQNKLNDATAKLGEAMAPINTALAEFAAAFVEQIAPAIQDFVNNYGQQLSGVLSVVAEALGAVISFIVDNIEVIGTVAGVILAIVAAINLYNAAMAIYNIVMAPVNLTILAIVAAIVALIAIITAIIVYWDEIKAGAVACWEGIKSIWGAVSTWFDEFVLQPIISFFTGLWDGIKNIFNQVIGFFQSILSWIGENWQGLLLLLINPFAGAFKLIYDNCESFREAVDEFIANIKQFFVDLWEGIKETFSAVGSWFSNIFTKARDGIKNAFSSVVGFFSDIWNKIKNIFSKVGTSIGDGIKKAVSGAVNKVLSTACKIINGFINAINFAIGIINALPGVSIGKISTLSVPAMAKGGIVDSATLALIGEQGKEAVVPLENNTEWMDTLASRLSASMGGQGPIILQVDGKTFGEISVNSINQLTRQRGKLALNIV